MGIASEVSCAQRKKVLAGIAVTEVASTTLVKELISENAPCRETRVQSITIYYEMVHGRLYRADESNTAGNDDTDQAATIEGVVADASHRP